jgi:riboflavin kinase/FMN adenylyltransferase
MPLYQELSQSRPEKEVVFAIGVFDGVHRGHQHLMSIVRDEARHRGALSGAITFANHPRNVLLPENPILLINDITDRIKLLSEQVDFVVPLTFDIDLSRIRAREFCQNLVELVKMNELVVGPDFALGFQREGTPQVLAEIGMDLGFSVRVVDLFLQDQQGISSTVIRTMIEGGNVVDAGNCLGYPVFLKGMVQYGSQQGRILGFPTANVIPASSAVTPRDGVYAGLVSIGEDRARPAAISVGTRPTFGKNARVVEAFIIDFDADIYGRGIKIEFHKWLRDQAIFDSMEDLKSQMSLDVESVVEFVESLNLG